MTSKTSVQPPGSNTTKDDHDHKGGQSSVRDPEMRCGFKEHVAGSVKTSRKATTIRVFEKLKQGWTFVFVFVFLNAQSGSATENLLEASQVQMPQDFAGLEVNQ